MYFALASCHLESRNFFYDEINGELSKQLLGMRHCHLAALARDDSALNWRVLLGHTACALSLVTDMTDFLVRATRRELDARSIVTSNTCLERATAVFNGKCSHLLFGRVCRNERTE